VAEHLLTVEDAAAYLGVSRSKVFDLLRAGDLPSLRVGAHRRFRPEALAAFARRLEQEESEERAAKLAPFQTRVRFGN
jgi:excisionase family DNA binding protein